MAAATDGLREGLNWGELVNAGGSPAPLLALHTSHPTDQVTAFSFLLFYAPAACIYGAQGAMQAQQSFLHTYLTYSHATPPLLNTANSDFTY